MIDRINSPNFNDIKKQDLTNFEIPESNMLNAENTFQIYEQLRPILPKTKVIKSEIIHSVRELLDKVDDTEEQLSMLRALNTQDCIHDEFTAYLRSLATVRLSEVLLRRKRRREAQTVIEEFMKDWKIADESLRITQRARAVFEKL